jgi:N-acetylglutamate synthase-like GNAT family acetyltransferase
MYEGTRDATINDLGGIEQLLRPLVELDIVVNRPREQACTLLYTGPSSEHKSLLR